MEQISQVQITQSIQIESKKLDLNYPHIKLFDSVKPSKRIFLGKQLVWTFKKDGENIHIRLIPNPELNGEPLVRISSRNMDIASQEIVTKVTESEDYPKYIQMINDNPNYVPYFEECRKGRSVTGIEQYDRTTLFLFDILDLKTQRFLPYTLVHQTAFHYDIPVVPLYQVTRHRTIKDLTKYTELALEYCNNLTPYRLEGMVVKAYGEGEEFDKFGDNGLLMFKVKLDIPKPKKPPHIQSGEPEFPPLPENEVMNSINKVHQELGDEITDVRKAMPLVAKYVGEAQKQEKFGKPLGNLYSYYQEYLKEFVNQDEEESKEIDGEN
jgi:hypothetical protein